MTAAQMIVIARASDHSAATVVASSSQFGAPPPGDACGAVVELDEHFLDGVGVVALVAASAEVDVDMGVTALSGGRDRVSRGGCWLRWPSR